VQKERDRRREAKGKRHKETDEEKRLRERDWKDKQWGRDRGRETEGGKAGGGHTGRNRGGETEGKRQKQ
jgi:hypothetical protein